MKTTTLILTLMCFVLLCSCSQEENERNSKVQLSSHQNLSESLETLNTNLRNSIMVTRGKNPEQHKKDTVKVDVVDADIAGAVAGGMAGLYADIPHLGAKALVTLVTTVVGAGVASVTAGAHNGYVVSGNGNNSNATIDEMTDCPNSMNQLCSINDEMVEMMQASSELSMPAQYSQALKVGIMHNLLLENFKNNMVVKNLNERTLADNKMKVFNGRERLLKEVIYDCKLYKSRLQELSKTTNIGLVTKSFLSIYNECISCGDKKSALQTIQSYTDFIVKSEDLKDEERKCLLSSLSVAWYSFIYWETQSREIN